MIYVFTVEILQGLNVAAHAKAVAPEMEVTVDDEEELKER